MGKNALVTFTIGDRYVEGYKTFRPSHERYCKKFGADHIELCEPLVEGLTGARFIIPQKLLICSQEWSAQYDKIAWVDSDIYISENAENIWDATPEGKIGMVSDDPFGKYNYRKYTWAKKGWEPDTLDDPRRIKAYQKQYNFYEEGFKCEYDCNPGVMVFQPKHHADYLKGLFDKMLPRIRAIPDLDAYGRRTHFDGWVWYHFQNDDMMALIDYRFNMVWPIYRSQLYEPYDTKEDLLIPMKNFIDTAYFVHLTDLEDLDVFQHLKNGYLDGPPTSLVINYKKGKGFPWLFSKWIRMKKFENIWIVSDDSEPVEYMTYAFPRPQYGFRVPEYYKVVKELPAEALNVRRIVCDSDWVEKVDFMYMVTLFGSTVAQRFESIKVEEPIPVDEQV
jgi:hypothetical protein